MNLAGIVIGAGWLVALFLPHLKVISQPGPVEYNEPAIWHATWLLDHGRNPYTAKELPGAAYCFGPLYNYVVIAFKPLLGLDYSAHRMVNLIFLAGALFLMARLMRKAGAGLGIALLATACYYWMSLYNIMITARPDTMGLFFFLLGLFVPWEFNYTRWPTIIGLLCALVAFHCKFYFALAGCATLLGVFLVRSKREGCWLGVGFFAALGLSFLGFWRAFPYYYLETVVIQRYAAILNSHQDISDMHTVMLWERAWPFLLIMAGGFVAWLWRRQAVGRGKPEEKSRTGLAWISATRTEALSGIFLIFLLVVFCYMGRNAGAFFTYHLHLLFPPMFVLTACVITRPWIRIAAGLLLGSFVMGRLDIPPVPDATVPYRHLEDLITGPSPGEILGIPCLTDIFERNDRKVLHNGNTMFLGFALADGRAARDPMAAIIENDFREVEAEATARLKAQIYGLVFTEFDRPVYSEEEVLKKYYDKVEEVNYFTYFGHSPVGVWRPKSRNNPSGGQP